MHTQRENFFVGREDLLFELIKEVVFGSDVDKLISQVGELVL